MFMACCSTFACVPCEAPRPWRRHGDLDVIFAANTTDHYFGDFFTVVELKWEHSDPSALATRTWHYTRSESRVLWVALVKTSPRPDKLIGSISLWFLYCLSMTPACSAGIHILIHISRLRLNTKYKTATCINLWHQQPRAVQTDNNMHLLRG